MPKLCCFHYYSLYYYSLCTTVFSLFYFLVLFLISFCLFLFLFCCSMCIFSYEFNFFPFIFCEDLCWYCGWDYVKSVDCFWYDDYFHYINPTNSCAVLFCKGEIPETKINLLSFQPFNKYFIHSRIITNYIKMVKSCRLICN